MNPRLLALALTLGCGEDKPDDTAPLPETDSDADTDTDADSDADTDADSDTDADTDTEVDGLVLAYFAVHLDPASAVDPISGEINSSRPSAYIEDLLDLVVAADAYEHRLTLMFTPQWAAWILDPASSFPSESVIYDHSTHTVPLNLVRAFEAKGHEIAIHHHALTSPASWDGFTDAESWQADRDGDGNDETYLADGSGPHDPDPHYLGDMEAFMAWVGQLPVDGHTPIVSGTAEEWPPGFLNSASGGPADYESYDTRGDLVSQPCAAQHGDSWLWQVRMRSFTESAHQTEVLDEELPAALLDFADAEGLWTTGFVTHAKNVADTSIIGYEALFADLDAAGLRLSRLQDVIGAFSHTATAPDKAPENLHCQPDEPETEPE